MLFFGNREKLEKGLEECRNTSGAVLIDVREADEYAKGHIPGAVNIPLSLIESMPYIRSCPLYLYCLSGARSRKAAGILKRMGYTNVRNIGGISSYKGEIEK